MTRFGELLKGSVTTGSVEKIDELPPRPEEEIASNIESSSDLDFNSMSKLELESYGRTLGVELDRRQSKDKLINQLKNIT
jgi:hypothetical protein|tara:strand:- start:423 stop:662 length:240 start_codon:yes stop_codon:yes gene_type:complete